MTIKDTFSDKAAGLHQKMTSTPTNKPLQVAGGEQLLNPAKIMAEIFKVEPGQHVADFGTGSMAYFALQAAKLAGNEGKVYAVDVIKHVLQSAASQAKLSGLSNVIPVWSDLETIGAAKIPQASLDAVTIVNVLFQSKKPDLVLQEAHRLLKLGGRLLVIDWKPGNISFAPQQRITKEAVKQAALSSGFVMDQEFDPGKYHWGMIFSKR
ncbi:MAG: methyltransferase domain-containing protein [bacterium]